MLLCSCSCSEGSTAGLGSGDCTGEGQGIPWETGKEFHGKLGKNSRGNREGIPRGTEKEFHWKQGSNSRGNREWNSRGNREWSPGGKGSCCSAPALWDVQLSSGWEIPQKRGNSHFFPRYLARVTDTEATDTRNPNLNYGIVVDCGSSGSRVFVYCWPRHNGNPKDLLDIQQMRDSNRKPVVMKIKPGISEFASSPDKVSDYISPLLSFAAKHVPRSKHKETPLYILCTQKAILEDLLTDIPVHFDFLFSDSHAETYFFFPLTGVYAWIGINFVLGRFEHTDDEDEAVVEVPGKEPHEPIFRKRTVGILDMGGVSTQIAYEVPQSVSLASPHQVIIPPFPLPSAMI
uniref:Ectonucleoside triphosphate diphosphohydrolase 4 n=1 Tax=Ficedula albicollis TaxID=59894 RepID=A0A803VZE2_FICAL